METTMDADLRAATACPCCGATIKPGGLMCWTCFKAPLCEGHTAYKYWQGAPETWKSERANVSAWLAYTRALAGDRFSDLLAARRVQVNTANAAFLKAMDKALATS